MNRHRASLGMRVTAVVSAALLIQSSVVTMAASQPQAQAAAPATATKIPADQLDSLVAPIALYPDPLLAQVLAASTYPLEIVQLQQWMEKNPEILGDKLAAAIEKQPWDPSVKGLAGVHDVVKRLGDDIQWTNDLGNAFLAQPSDVMDAVQRMRKKASDAGNLKTSEQLKVTTEVVQTKEVIVIQQADPQVIYVPAYNPVVVYGAPVYPYPPIYYPPPYYYGAMAIGFGVGIAMGAFWGGGWGYGPRWGYGSINVNVNNRYVNHYNRNTNINRAGGNWNHNPAHRGGTPYGDRGTADRFGGSARGDSLSSRQTGAQNRGTSARTQPSTGANRAGANRSTAGVSNLSGSGSGRSASGGADRVGNRSIPSSSNRSGNAFGGASTSRSTGSAARSASSRGSGSVGGSRARGGGGGGRRR